MLRKRWSRSEAFVGSNPKNLQAIFSQFDNLIYKVSPDRIDLLTGTSYNRRTFFVNLFWLEWTPLTVSTWWLSHLKSDDDRASALQTRLFSLLNENAPFECSYWEALSWTKVAANNARTLCIHGKLVTSSYHWDFRASRAVEKLNIKFVLLLRTCSCPRTWVSLQEIFLPTTFGTSRALLEPPYQRERLWCWTKKVFEVRTVHTGQSTTNLFKRQMASSKEPTQTPELTPSYQCDDLDCLSINDLAWTFF